MDQKDQDGYQADKSQFFFNFKALIHQLKHRPDKKLKYAVHQFVYKSHNLLTKQGWQPQQAPRGLGTEGPNQQGDAKTTDRDPLPPFPPGGPPSALTPILFINNDSYIKNSAQHIFTFDFFLISLFKCQSRKKIHFFT